MKPEKLITEQRAAIEQRKGSQWFTGQPLAIVEAALDAQLDVLDNRLTEGQARAKYEAGNDFILGSAMSAAVWLADHEECRPPDSMWPDSKQTE